jgi:hypothetical protein
LLLLRNCDLQLITHLQLILIMFLGHLLCVFLVRGFAVLFEHRHGHRQMVFINV